MKEIKGNVMESCLPKNLSDEDYHQKYHYTKLAYQKTLKRMEQAELDLKTDNNGEGIGSNGEDLTKERQRSWSLMSDESGTAYSEDYTAMTEDNSDLGSRTSPNSSDDFSDGSSVGTLGNGDAVDIELVGSFGKLFDKGDVDMVRNVKHSAAAAAEAKMTVNVTTQLNEQGLPSPTEMIEAVVAAHENGHNFFEDREFDFLKTEKPRRSTSLKTTKTPPGTPSRKKAVRFADALGLDLESVRHILNLDTPPRVPSSAMKDLKVGLEEEQKDQGSRYLTACFSQPGALPDFVLRIQHKKVMLENCLVDDRSMTITGTIRVANVSYHKSVVVRFTVNNWATHHDIQASYVHNSGDGATDRFAFTINVPLYFKVGSILEFALMYTAGGDTFWDNNYGSNYKIECYARALPSDDGDQTWVHFM